MERFEVFDHTADIGIRAYGATIGETFENAARAMFHIITPTPGRGRAKMEKFVSVEASDLEELLVAWLSELLYFFDVERFIPMVVKVVSIGRTECGRMVMTARIRGGPFSTARCGLEREIKAVTYHLLRVEPTASGTRERQWMAQVIFDI